MQKIKIRLPATITNLGPGLQSLGLALGLYVTVEISGRDDEQLSLVATGEAADHYSTPLRHPVTLALGHFFQRLERAQLGINIRIENQVPVESGLGAEAAFTMAGVLGANNLLGGLYRRDELLRIAAAIYRPDGVTAALLGGLTAAAFDDQSGDLIYRGLPVAAWRVIVVLPELGSFTRPGLPEQLPRRDALFTLRQVPLLIDALRTGDAKLIRRVLDDRLYAPRLAERITGYGHVVEIARRSGALAVTTCGDGPALFALAEDNHEVIAEDMAQAFNNAGVKARTWVLPVDTQGVVISAVQSG
jgi:homoserine kinase